MSNPQILEPGNRWLSESGLNFVSNLCRDHIAGCGRGGEDGVTQDPIISFPEMVCVCFRAELVG